MTLLTSVFYTLIFAVLLPTFAQWFQLR